MRTNLKTEADSLFWDMCANLWEAMGDLDSWTSGYTERVWKSLVSISLEPEKYGGCFDESAFSLLFREFTSRKLNLVTAGVVL